MSDNSFGSMLGGMIIGGAIGYIFGTLYAPKEGELMRGELKEKYLEKSEQAESVLRDFLAKEESDLSELKESIKAMFGDWEGSVSGTKEKVQNEYQQQKTKLMKELEKLEQAYNAGKAVYSGTAPEAETKIEKEAVVKPVKKPAKKAATRRKTTASKASTKRKKTSPKAAAGEKA